LAKLREELEQAKRQIEAGAKESAGTVASLRDEVAALKQKNVRRHCIDVCKLNK